ncbi:hypothetical protein KKHLCK_04405 [Candidatus Electrothrix laxa]
MSRDYTTHMSIKKNKRGLFNAHVKELLHGVSIALFLKILASSFSFFLHITLARLLGAEEYGIFFMAFTIIFIVATIGRLGMDNALVRFIAVNIAKEKTDRIFGGYRKVMLLSAVMAISFSMIIYLQAPWISQFIFRKPKLAYPLSIMALAVAPLALLTLHAYALQGLKAIASSILILNLFVPLITCLISLLFVPYFGIDAAVWGYVVSTFLTLLFGRLLWLKATRSLKKRSVAPESSRFTIFNKYLFGISLIDVVMNWSPLLFLGIWESSANIGIYNAANRTAMLTNFILIAVNTTAAPKFAELYQNRDIKTLNSVVQKTTKLIIYLACPMLFVFLFFPKFVLSFFGESFTSGASILVILSIAQLVNMATGLTGCLLIMSGNEILQFNIICFCISLWIILNLILIPNFGITGGAVASMLLVILINSINMIYVWKRLNIFTFPFCVKYMRN